MSRRRWTYTMGGVPLPEPVEVSEDFQSHAERQGALIMCDRFMEGHTTVDGVDIGSRRKREEYKRANGLEDAGDFAEHWKRKAEERKRPRSSPHLTEQIVRAYDQLSRKRG